LQPGEIGVDITNNKFKIGNGEKMWSELSYFINETSVQSLLESNTIFAPLANPSLTGIPTAPTAAQTVNSTQIATTAYVKAAISALVGGADSTLDTLQEIATYLNGNSTVTGITNVLGTKAPTESPTFTGTITTPLDQGIVLSGAGGVLAKSMGVGFLKNTGTELLPTWTWDNNTYLTGNQSITLSGDVSGSGATSISISLATMSGLAAGTYNDSSTSVRPFTIDTKGRITSIGTAVTIAPTFANVSSKPTTLSGYGITDAQKVFIYNSIAADTAGNTNTSYTPFGSSISLATGVYEVDMLLSITTGTTSHNVTFTLLGSGTATLTNLYTMDGYNMAVGTTPTLSTTASTFYTVIATSTAAVTAISGSTVAGKTIKVKGLLRVTGAGTIIPTLALSAATGSSNVMKANSFISIKQIG
jgi:hypothetical protein